MFLLLNWLNELNMKKANEKICSKVVGILDQSLIDLQEEKSNLFRDCFRNYKLPILALFWIPIKFSTLSIKQYDWAKNLASLLFFIID